MRAKNIKWRIIVDVDDMYYTIFNDGFVEIYTREEYELIISILKDAIRKVRKRYERSELFDLN